jgi:hypothetical protein
VPRDGSPEVSHHSGHRARRVGIPTTRMVAVVTVAGVLPVAGGGVAGVRRSRPPQWRFCQPGTGISHVAGCAARHRDGSRLAVVALLTAAPALADEDVGGVEAALDKAASPAANLPSTSDRTATAHLAGNEAQAPAPRQPAGLIGYVPSLDPWTRGSPRRTS